MKLGKHFWFNFWWFSGNEPKLFSLVLLEKIDSDWTFLHFQIFKFIVAFGRWA